MRLHFAVRWEAEEPDEMAQCKCCGGEIWRAARRLLVSVRMTNHAPENYVPTGVIVCDSCYEMIAQQHAQP